MLKLAVPVLHISSSRAAETFYCERLGFRREFANRLEGEQDDPCYIGLTRDGVWLHLSSFPGDGVPGSVANLYVEDIERLYSELVTNGIMPEMDPTEQTWGTREVYLKDMDGNSLRFVQAEVSGDEAAEEASLARVPGTRFEGAAPILSVSDLLASVHYYVEVLGFQNAEWGDADFTSVTRDGAGIYLCRGEQGHPGTWAWIGVEDAATLYEEYRASGAVIRHAPRNYPWALELQVADPDGHILRFGSEPLAGAAFDAWQG